ncbi:type II and III secretion system protein family protein [Aestuariicoccus sp. MJ-SS9]|uniref:type II and III secretion system protein family protein n=1 Tax=Aestuariicoccus sp. MJ-SS9 TaxID=3079855 RepID=UPI0029073632|nr:type II and III secretion system protein family protein [Aestuariicoccus sp. MJ-SS9]MDU8913272.1 type II and III secretion system protein family protein [Aestuariicoccus sp. MJ-SS9]
MKELSREARLVAARFRSARLAGVLSALLAFVAFTSQAQAQVRDIIIDDGIVSKVQMAPGTTLTIETNQPFADILIGNTAVIDVFPLTDNSLYVQAKTTGTTNVTLYSVDKQLLEVVDVRVRNDFTELERAIRSAVPSSRVTVDNVNNRIRLGGEVKDNVDLNRVVQIAQQFAGENPVINGIRVKSAQQVELDVRILEVERNAGRNLGVNLTGAGATTGRPVFQTQSSGTSGGTPFGSFVGELLEISGVQIDFVINALESKGLARRLANPKLITTSGIEANFVVGGEIPISRTTVGDNGSVGTETGYREYGVRLNFQPVVLDEGLINLRITPEVSDVDFSNLVNGQPAFITRRADTTVSLRDGQSFAIAGLLQANNARNIEQLPWLGQLPVIGALFRSTGFQKRESDLVILVTPRLVRPTAPNEKLASPLDDTRSTNDIELFLLGMMEVDRPLLRRFREGEGVVGPYGHIIDLEFEDGVIEKK